MAFTIGELKIGRSGYEMLVIDSSTCKKFNNVAFYKSAKAGQARYIPWDWPDNKSMTHESMNSHVIGESHVNTQKGDVAIRSQ